MYNKYKNKKIKSADGLMFDSRKELVRWNVLQAMEEAGEIEDLQRQVKFTLIPTQREPSTVGKRGGLHLGKVIEKECYYVADFRYFDKSGILHVEDVKGYKGGGAYSIFKIKKKLMLYIHGIIVEEI